MQVRPETPADTAAIRTVVAAAFESAPHRSGTEAEIVDALRGAGALAVSFIAEEDGEIVGHIAFSPVTIDGETGGWFGLGPAAVRPDKQRGGIGQALIRAGLERLRAAGAQGCVVLGDPLYYDRFGFRSVPELRYRDAPAEYFRCLVFRGEQPTGDVGYHPAFSSTAAPEPSRTGAD